MKIFRIQTRLLILMVSVISFFGIVMSVMHRSEDAKITDIMESRNDEKQALVKELISLYGEPSRNMAFDYSVWDEMVTFIKSPRVAWARENIDMGLETFKSSVAWVYDTNGNTIYSSSDARYPSLSQNASLDSTIMVVISRNWFNHFFCPSEYGVMEIFTAPVQPSEDNARITPPYGFFIVGRILDEQYVQKIADVTELVVAVLPAVLSPADFSPGRIDIIEPLAGVDGSAVAFLHCQGEDRLYARFERGASAGRVFHLIAGWVLFSLLFISLYVWLTRPLNKISAALKCDDVQAVTSLSKVRSEFGQIARLIKDFCEQKTELERQIDDQIRIRKELAKSEKRYRVVSEQTGQMVYDWDIATGKITWGGAIETITGFSSDEYQKVDIGEWEKMIHPDDRHGAVSALYEAAQKGYKYIIEYRLQYKDGYYIFIEENGVFILNNRGEAVQMLGTMRDITERKRAEASLRESETAVRNKLNAIMEPEGDLGTLALADIIDIATFQSIMEVFHRITGIASAVIDTNGKVLVGVGWQDICTKFHRSHPETLKNCIESDTVLTQGVAPGTFKTYRCKNHLLDMATPIVLDGKHLGNFFIGQYLYSDDQIDIESFRRRARRYGFDEVEYLAALDKVPRYDRKIADEIMTFYFKFTGMVSSLSYSTIRLARTLAERQRAEARQAALQDQLERAQRMESLAVLAGGVAHDLNNMLGPVVGYSELLLRTLPADSDPAVKTKRIMKSAQDAAEVIQDLLTLARRGRYEKKPLDMNEIVFSYLESVGFQKLKERHQNVEFATRLYEKPGIINGSRPHLEKVLMNLVANGCEAMSGGGTLTIETEEKHLSALLGGYSRIDKGQYVLIRVKDTGSGINKADLRRIFEPYFSKKHLGNSGSGLGLPVVYGIVKDHGGYYDVFSEVGKGTEFVLYFPTSNVSIEKMAKAETAIMGGTESILIVDDSREQREMAYDMASSLGYRVNTAVNGHEAVKFLQSNRVDLLILDMIMEADFDGLATYREVIKIRPGQKAIIVSGFSATANVQELQKLGAGGYIKKPYTLDAIARAIRDELDGVKANHAPELMRSAN